MIQLTLTCSSAEHATFVLDAYAGYQPGKLIAEPTPAATAEPAAATREVTIQDVRAVLAAHTEDDLISEDEKRQRKDEVIALLATFGADKVSGLQPDQYAAFLAAAEKL